MKIIYIYTNPQKSFMGESAKLIKLQIDNDLELGWQLSDIKLYTNFAYEYRGVEAQIVPDIYTKHDPTSNKIPVILYLLQNHLLEDDLYWYHDLDVYQLIWFAPPDVKSFAVARYGYKDEWQCGSFFFRTNTEAFFKTWDDEMDEIVKHSDYNKSRTDEKALKGLVSRQALSVEELNHTYNFVYKYHHKNFETVDKPIKVVHSHPTPEALDAYLSGSNPTNQAYFPQRLTNLFHQHGFFSKIDKSKESSSELQATLGSVDGLTFGGMVQFHNEMPQNLPRVVASMRQLCKYVVGYDNASTDGSREWADANLDVCLHGELNDWDGQISLKSKMLEELKKLGVDWVLWLDADEELSPPAIKAIHEVIQNRPEITGIYIYQVNLWSNQQHYRVDRKFGKRPFLRLWRNRPELVYQDFTRGLHQEQFPPAANEITATLSRDQPVIHYAWDSSEKIRAKHARYAAMGQTGEDLDRLAEDPNAVLEQVKPEWFWTGS